MTGFEDRRVRVMLSRSRSKLRRGRDAVTARGRFLNSARELSRYVSAELDGATYLVSTLDPGVGHDLFVNAHRPELVVLPRALSVVGPLEETKSCFVDLGANVGSTTIPALLRHGFTEAVACEPGPESAMLLRVNALLNGLEDAVTVIEAAVADEEGQLLFDVSAPKPGAFQVAHEASTLPDPLVVTAMTLDGLVERGTIVPERVGLVWIDVQGYEAHVLSGAARLLEHRPPLVLALRPKKLKRSGMPHRFAEVLEQYYTQVVELRRPSLREPLWKPDILPIGEVRTMLSAGSVTDVLVLGEPQASA